MTDSIKNGLLVVSSLTLLALGGAALAGAASGDDGQSGSSTSTAVAPSNHAPPPDVRRGQRPDEELLSGDTASKVRAAALARVDGGTIERVETDADGHALYEAHMLDANGGRVTVYVNADFDVVSLESGR